MPTPQNEWMVCVPLSQLVAMQSSTDELNKLRQENIKLQNRVEGLNRQLYQTMELVCDLRKSVQGQQGARCARVG